MQKISQVIRSARILVFLDQERAVDNFVATGAFATLIRRHRVSFVTPPSSKRMPENPASQYSELDWRVLEGDEERTSAWSRLAMLDQLRWRPGEHWRKVRRMRRLALGRRERLILSALALPGVRHLDRWRQRQRLAASHYDDLERLLDQERPDIVIHPSALNGIYINDLVLAARRRAIPSVIIMNSWDNPSSKNTVEAPPDHFLVWGEQTAAHAARFMGLPPERITILGAPQFEQYRGVTVDRTAIAQSLGLDPARPILLYGESSLLSGDYRRLQQIDAWCRQKGSSAPQVLYRTYPWRREKGDIDAILQHQWTHVTIQRSSVNGDQGPIVGRTASRFAALATSDAVLSPLSTIVLEGLLMRQPILCLFPEDEIAAEFAPANAPLAHFAEILNHPDAVVVRRDQDLVPGLDRLMAMTTDPGAQSRLASLVDRIVAPLEGNYADRLSSFVESVLEKGAADVPTDRVFA